LAAVFSNNLSCFSSSTQNSSNIKSKTAPGSSFVRLVSFSCQTHHSHLHFSVPSNSSFSGSFLA
jgi:hypothetical protein